MTLTYPTDWLECVLSPELAHLVEGRVGSLLAATPLEDSAEHGCRLKRDDLGLFATHKSRGLGLQMALSVSGGAPGVVISSSGNAAVAMGGWCRDLGVSGIAFLSHKTETAKIHAVVETGVATVVTPKPKNFSRYAARYAGLDDLRPSRHEHGCTGYRLLAPELVWQLGDAPSDVFFFVNSGLTLVGAFEGFSALHRRGLIRRLPSLHAVQCTAETELASAVRAVSRPEPRPAAGALGAQTPTDLGRTVEAIAGTGGGVWMVLNSEVRAEEEAMRRGDRRFALESAAALAGFRRARRAGATGDRPVVLVAAPERSCELSRERVLARTHRVVDYGEMRALLGALGLEKTDG